MRDSGGSENAPDDGPGASEGSVSVDEDGSERPAADPPSRDADGAGAPPTPSENPVRWYLQSDDPVVVGSRDVLTSVLLVGMIGLTLFAVSGVWPPMVAIESGSMEPNMQKGDLVVVVESDRFTSQHADANGIVTESVGDSVGHQEFGEPGSVIVYQPNGQERTPIIHRTSFHVEEGENWVEDADPEHLGGSVNCDDLPRACPAPHDGYVTRGDANPTYDQAGTQSNVVNSEWVNGKAVARAPYLGCIRLELSPGPKCFEEQRGATLGVVGSALDDPTTITQETVPLLPRQDVVSGLLAV